MEAARWIERPQPDFDRIASGFTRLGEQFRFCANLPAIDHGGQLLRAVEGLRQLVEDIQTRQVRMERRKPLDEGTGRLTVSSEANALSRSLNATVTKPDQRLERLRSVQTGAVIPGFPESVAEIGSMNAARVNAVLEALGQPVEGSVAERRRRLKVIVGVTMQAV
ncbi:hypothetical protein LX36DRAFT_594399 [Colletotrichum falcatum]|nr:hypothetical protein LX36DRAFT_594399 [Colletotrichum falcatum]